MKIRVLVLCLTFLFSVGAMAQQKITGIVIDNATKETLVGVSVLVKGTTVGTMTNMDGKYSITVPNSNSELVFSYITFASQTIPVGVRSNIDVNLLPDVETLDQLVVVGFGSVKKSDLTSSIASVKGKDLQSMSVGNVNQALQGKVAGVQIVSAGGPGGAQKVLIRGFSSLNLTTDPLYVIDGVPMGGGSNFLNPNEIQSMEVLKDASASAIYGSRASNGVILITTKKGIAGKTQFNADLSYGLQMRKTPYDMADAVEYASAFNQASSNTGLPNLFDNPNDYAGKTTDWWNAGIRKSSPQMNLSFSMQGGTEKNTYAVSLNYYKQESFYEVGGWDKFTARISSDYKISKVVSAGVSLNPRFESWGNPSNWQDFIRIDPITPIYKPAEQLTGDENEYSIYARSPSYVWNPVATVKRYKQKNESYALSTTGYLQIKPMADLIFRSQVSMDIDSRIQDNFSPDFVIDPAHEYNAINKVSRSRPFSRNWSMQNTLTYLKTIQEKHNLSAMVGNTLEEWNSVSLWGEKSDLPNNSDVLQEIDAATKDPQTTGTSATNSIMSYLGRVSYNYQQKYYLTATYRVDGSSKFLSNNKWASFPSASVAWRASNEQFMENIKPIVNDLKLRVGWGQVGNQNLPASVYMSKLGQNYYPLGNDVLNTTYPSAMANKDIKWETVEDINAGVDFGLFGNLLSGSVEYYVKNTKDMLFKKAYPSYSGYPDDARIWSNVGTMQSKGIEVSLTHNNTIGDFKYGANLTFTTVNVKVTKMTGDKEPLYGSGEKTITIVDEEPAYFFGYQADGLFQNTTELNSHTNNAGKFLQPNAVLGDIRFKDVNGDGALNAEDRTKIGSPWADFTMGLNLNFEYKGFDLLLNFYASVGNDLVNQNKNELHNAVQRTNKVAGIENIAWHGEGTSTNIPRLSRADNNENYSKFSSFYIEDGSFLRLKNVQLGYSLPKNIIEKFNFNKVRCYVSAQNVMTLTKYKGVDPEVGGDVLGFGFGAWNYPVLPTIIFGVNLSF